MRLRIILNSAISLVLVTQAFAAKSDLEAFTTFDARWRYSLARIETMASGMPSPLIDAMNTRRHNPRKTGN